MKKQTKKFIEAATIHINHAAAIEDPDFCRNVEDLKMRQFEIMSAYLSLENAIRFEEARTTKDFHGRKVETRLHG